eukprot:m.250527 g.250527  ORF g.250527 m.250527 type:complete len:1140 (+) comp15439_c0_seq2:174-3593(+)
MDYDEDLFDNPFFQALQTSHKQLYAAIQQERHMLCVPRQGSVNPAKLTVLDFQAHVFQKPEETTNVEFLCSLNDQTLEMVAGDTGALKTGNGYPESRLCRILFDETFFNDDDKSYKVLCIDKPLQGDVIEMKPPVVLTSLMECKQFLDEIGVTSKLWKKAKQWADNVGSVFAKLPSDKRDAFSATASDTYAKTVALVLRDATVKRNLKLIPNGEDAVKLALETWLINHLSTYLVPVYAHSLADRDSQLNKQTRNLTHLTVRDFQLPTILMGCIQRAASESLGLRESASPLEKLVVVERIFEALTAPPVQDKELPAIVMAADDVLSALCLVIINAELPNWNAHLSYINELHLSSIRLDKMQYCLTSLEAAIEYIISLDPDQEFVGRRRRTVSTASVASTSAITDSYLPSRNLFRAVADDDLLGVQMIVSKSQITRDVSRALLAVPTDVAGVEDSCDPLCTCPRCNPPKTAVDTIPSALVSRDRAGKTALHRAAVLGHTTIMEYLVQQGSKVDAKDYNDNTPLHLACANAHPDAVVLLIDANADVSHTDNRGNTPLHICARNGHNNCAQALLFSQLPKLNINARNNRADTPLHLAARWGFADVVASLLHAGARRDIRNHRKELPLACAHSKLIEMMLLCKVEDLDDLVQQYLGGAETSAVVINPKADNGVQSDEQESVQDVAGAAVATVTAATSPASTSTVKRHTSWRSKLLSSRPSIIKQHKNQSTDQQHVPEQVPTPLTTSAALDPVTVESPTAVRIRADHHADLISLFQAVEKGDLNLVRYRLHMDNTLVDHPNNPYLREKCDPLCQCERCIEISRSSPSLPMTVNTVDADGHTTLHVACKYGHVAIVRDLLDEAQANPCAETARQQTPLHFACQYNHADVVELLIQHGVSLNAVDGNGATSLHYCASNGHIEAAKLLVGAGAQVDIQDARGNTCLHLAAKWSRVELARLLIIAGADCSIQNNIDKSPADECVNLVIQDMIAGALAGERPQLPTVVEVCGATIRPDLNGTYEQIGNLPCCWEEGVMSSALSDTQRPLFQWTREATSAPRELYLYFQLSKEAWVIATSVGHSNIAAVCPGNVIHPFLLMSTWEVIAAEDGEDTSPVVPDAPDALPPTPKPSVADPSMKIKAKWDLSDVD